MRHFRELAPSVDGQRRRGQYLAYRRGGREADGRGRHYPLSGYWDPRGEWRSATLQGCPKEIRKLLACEFCHDLDFINSLPTVATQLDTLGLCDAAMLTSLKDYVGNRQSWFDEIIAVHQIRDVPGLSEARDVAKALPLRLLHGGTYHAWVNEFGVKDAGVAAGIGGVRRVLALQRQLLNLRHVVVATFERRHPDWTRAALARAERKKAKGRSLTAMPQAERLRVTRRARASVFAQILQDYEDQCLMAALRSLQRNGWRTHSLQLDGLLVEEARSESGGPAVPLKDDTVTGALGAISLANAAIVSECGIEVKMTEKSFHRSTLRDSEEEELIALLALPGSPPPKPTPLNISGQATRLTAQQVAAATGSHAAALERRAALATDAAYEAAARSAEMQAVAWATDMAGERSVRAAMQARQELEDEEAAVAACEAYECVLACQETDDEEAAMAAYDAYVDTQARQEREDDDAAMAAYDAYENSRSEQGEPTGGEDAAVAEVAAVDALVVGVGQMAVAASVADGAELQGGGAGGPMEVESGGGGEAEAVEAVAEAAGMGDGDAGGGVSSTAGEASGNSGGSRRLNGRQQKRARKRAAQQARAAAANDADDEQEP